METSERVEERSSFKTVFARLKHMNVAKGTLTGEIYRGGQAAYSFVVSDKGEFTFTSRAASAPQPITSRCRLKRARGIITIEWDENPGEQHLVVDYDYIDYTNGWSMLFIGLGAVYLVSSLCWLFIDCTKTLEAESLG